MDGNELLITTLAKLLRGENRQNLSPEEAMAIGDTTLNRPALRGYPDTPLEAILQPHQYAPFRPTDPNYPVIQKFGPDNPDWEKYYQLARQIADPQRKRSNYTHYFSGKPPAWASSLEGLTQIGSHWFGREARRPKVRAD